jgi:hypothetical protein
MCSTAGRLTGRSLLIQKGDPGLCRGGGRTLRIPGVYLPLFFVFAKADCSAALLLLLLLFVGCDRAPLGGSNLKPPALPGVVSLARNCSLKGVIRCKVLTLKWRREWDSFSNQYFRLCKLQKTLCHRCQECHHFHAALHSVARWPKKKLMVNVRSLR